MQIPEERLLSMYYMQKSNKKPRFIRLKKVYIVVPFRVVQLLGFATLLGWPFYFVGFFLFMLRAFPLKTNVFLSITFPTLLPSRTPYKNSKNTPSLDLVFRTRLLVFPENKIRTPMIWNFVSFFDVKGLYWRLYDPDISYNAIAGVVWTVTNDHDTKDTLKSYLKN